MYNVYNCRVLQSTEYNNSYIICKYMYHLTNTITKLAKWLYVDELRVTQYHDIETNPFSYDQLRSIARASLIHVL